MKKLFFALPVIAILALSSCKKTYVCNCVTKNTDTSFISVEIDQDISIKTTKGKSEDMCKENEATLNAEYGGTDVTTTCKIK